jgi:hypothetical protein
LVFPKEARKQHPDRLAVVNGENFWMHECWLLESCRFKYQRVRGRAGGRAFARFLGSFGNLNKASSVPNTDSANRLGCLLP